MYLQSGYYYLEAITGGGVYRVAQASWNCSQSNTLPMYTAPVFCQNWPMSITVTPCASCLFCDPTTSLPASIQLDISGLTNNACDCDVLNGTFVLDRATQGCTRTYYSATVLTGCPTSMWCPGARELTITATAQSMVGGVGWAVRLTLGRATYYFCGYSTVEYKWVTAAEAFDCSEEHELDFANTTDNYFCGNWSGATVTLTPL